MMNHVKQRIFNQAPSVLFLLALIFLAFTGGAVITVAEVFPAKYVRDAYRAGVALYAKHHTHHDPYATDLWTRARKAEKGTTLYKPEKAANGLTLYSSGHGSNAFLIDMQGRQVHEWRRPFSSVWDGSARVRRPVADRQVFFQKAEVFPNGDLLAIYIGVGDSPYGYGMVKLNKASEVIWKNLDYFHHDFAVAQEGNIYGLTHEYRTQPPEGVFHLANPVLDDFLVVLSPEGRELLRVSLLDAINHSLYRRLLWLVPYYSLEDPLHANDVEVLDPETARKLALKIPGVLPGQVLVSFRELGGGCIVLIDPQRQQIIWAMRGTFMSQHDPDILENGNFILFDNRGHYGPGGESRVIEVDPGTGAVVWQYTGDPEHPLESMIRSDQERLPNGNTLITESDGGRLLEVTPDKEMVWEFINPARGGQNQELIAVVSSGHRIGLETFEAGFKDALQARMTAGEDATP